jgi:hypothetical protein
MLDTDAVFHAPMFALKTDAWANTCQPNHKRSNPKESGRIFGADTCEPKQRRAGAGRHRQRRTRGRAWGAGTSMIRSSNADTFIYAAIRMDIDTCINHAYKYSKCVCSIDRSHLHTCTVCGIVSARTRNHMHISGHNKKRPYERNRLYCTIYICLCVCIHIEKTSIYPTCGYKYTWTTRINVCAHMNAHRRANRRCHRPQQPRRIDHRQSVSRLRCRAADQKRRIPRTTW